MAYTLVQRTVLGSTQTNISITNIPQTGKDLLILHSLRNTTGGTWDSNSWRLNGTDANQYSRDVRGDGSAITSNNGASLTYVVNGSGTTANTFSSGQTYITNYASTTASKQVLIDDCTEENSTGNVQTRLYAGWVNTTTAISSVQVNGTFAANTTLSVYIIS